MAAELGLRDVERLRLALEAMNRGDQSYIEAWSPDAELYELEGIPDAPQVYRGHAGVRRWLANAQSVAGRDFALVPDRFELRGEAIVVDGRVTGTAQGSGVPFDWPLFIVVWMRDERIIRTRSFLERDEAQRAAAG